MLYSQALTLQVERQVHHIAQVVKAIDVGVVDGGAQVVLDALDDDVRVHSQDGDERGVVVTEEGLDCVQHLQHLGSHIGC